MNDIDQYLAENPNSETFSCQSNCGFVVVFPMGDDGFRAWLRMKKHIERGCRLDNMIRTFNDE